MVDGPFAHAAKCRIGNPSIENQRKQNWQATLDQYHHILALLTTLSYNYWSQSVNDLCIIYAMHSPWNARDLGDWREWRVCERFIGIYHKRLQFVAFSMPIWKPNINHCGFETGPKIPWMCTYFCCSALKSWLAFSQWMLCKWVAKCTDQC